MPPRALVIRQVQQLRFLSFIFLIAPSACSVLRYSNPKYNAFSKKIKTIKLKKHIKAARISIAGTVYTKIRFVDSVDLTHTRMCVCAAQQEKVLVVLIFKVKFKHAEASLEKGNIYSREFIYKGN